MFIIKTYNDLLAIGENGKDRMDFVLSAIQEHKQSEQYRVARDAELYYKHQNPTIMRFQKFVYNQFGKKVPDIWSPNNKIASNWYNYFVTQGVQYLLGNGVSFGEKTNKDKLGKKFDQRIVELATHAKNGGVGFGFWNKDHLEVYSVTEFVPLYDEENGSLMAGIRFWQIDDTRPLRATLFELDGYTDYIKRNNEDIKLLPDKNEKPFGKRTYIVDTKGDKKDELDGTLEYVGRNYPSFPIVPMFNVNKQSELVGNQGTVDAYDLMISGLINNVSSGEFLYWVLSNCNGMDDADVAKFVEQLTVTHFAKMDHSDEGSKAEAHKAEVPFQASVEALDRLEKQLYKDFMALKVDDISAGATNDQIQSAYEPLNQKTDDFEYMVTDFIEGILALVGIEDTPTYTRSQLSNRKEIVEIINTSAETLPDEYRTKKILTVLGDGDDFDEVMQQKASEEINRYRNTSPIEE